MRVAAESGQTKASLPEGTGCNLTCVIMALKLRSDRMDDEMYLLRNLPRDFTRPDDAALTGAAGTSALLPH
jgi:hypothetical protein